MRKLALSLIRVRLCSMSRMVQETIKRPSGRFFTVTIDQFGAGFFQHPDDSVDLCAMPLKATLIAAEKQGIALFFRALDETYIRTDAELEELDAIEDVLMFGYPNALWDAVNNLPLIRRGITSSHPAIDFNGTSDTTIDIACFPGSSGSPVLIVDSAYSRDKKGNIDFTKLRVILLGVLYAGPTFTKEGEIIVRDIPTSVVPVPVTSMMMHLGYIVKAKEILACIIHKP